MVLPLNCIPGMDLSNDFKTKGITVSMRDKFETMIKEAFPKTDLSRDPDDPKFYLNEGTHHAWMGYQGMHDNTTNSNGDNRESDSSGDPG